MKEYTADICVIGGGPAGYVAAIRAAQLGGRAVLVERDELGGTCLNRGCIPTKALLQTARTLTDMARAREFGIRLPAAGEADLPAVLARKEQIVRALRGGLTLLMKKNGVEVLRGTGRMEAPGRVHVQTAEEELSVACGSIILATGSENLLPPIPGLLAGGKPADGVLVSDTALTCESVPARIGIIGSGAIGLEFAGFYRALGSEVTVIEMKDRILPEEDAEVTAALARAMKKRGIRLRTNAAVTGVASAPEGGLAVTLGGAGGSLAFDRLLLAAGRRPSLDASLAQLGIETSRGAIAVDDRMRTSLPGVFAAGDAVGAPLLAHLGFAQGRVAAENAMGLPSRLDIRAVPACVYTSPEVASVGLSEAAAREAGMPVRVGRCELRANGRALCHGERDGFVKVVVHADTGEILGGCIFGHEASELISELTLAVAARIPAAVVADLIHPHPTLAEAVGEACADALGRAIHR